MIHPDTRLVGVNPQVGFGVIATRKILSGTVVWVRDPLDLCLDSSAFARLPVLIQQQFTRHAYLDSDGHWLMTWDIARFVNHHCDYNCVVTPWGMEIACRDITEGEELSNDYALFQLDANEEFRCHCDASDCRQHIHSQDVAQHQQRHELQLTEALSQLTLINQPLWSLLEKWQLDILNLKGKPNEG